MFLANLFATLVLFELTLPQDKVFSARLPIGIHLSRVLLGYLLRDVFIWVPLLYLFAAPVLFVLVLRPLEVRLCCITAIL